MIPFASQRGNGQDLATHLMTAHDNERVELFEMRRAIARDLHGAFAEWEAIAKGLTRARQYLCSLSVNPDERQGRLTRAQYLHYIDRAEAALGLTGQPRAIIFHEKRGEDGVLREHCHVVWSRTDVKNKRAIPLSFFKERLMTVTREFARDHGLHLPPGYDQQDDERRRSRQLSAYDCVKQKETGVSHEERMAAITDAWQRSDSAKAFVAALGNLGYILAQGRNKTRIVLVDFYGHTTALTRLIHDASVRAKHVRDFLGADYRPEKLPSVEEAQALAAQRRKAIEAFEEARAAESDQAAALARHQATRREEVEAKAADLRRQQHDDRVQLAAAQKAECQALQSSYLAAQRRIRLDRARRRPRGLAAFLGRVSGITLIIRAIQRRRDRTRYAAYLAVRNAIKRRQQQERDNLARGHELQAAALRRRFRALDQIEKRERQTLETAALKARRRAINARHVHMPSLAPVLMRQDGVSARDSRGPRDTPLALEFARGAGQPVQQEQVRLTQAFERATGGSEDDSGEAGGTETPAPVADEKSRRHRDRRRRRTALLAAFAPAADGGQDEGRGGDRRSGDPKPAAEPNAMRRRRNRRARKRRDRAGALPRDFTEAARGGEEDSGEAGRTEAPAPAAEEKIRRRKRRRRKLDLDREFNSASGAEDCRNGNADSDAGPRRRPRGQGPPDYGGPPRPRRNRKRDLDRGR